eukprot:670619-Rhodomonas_salina.1
MAYPALSQYRTWRIQRYLSTGLPRARALGQYPRAHASTTWPMLAGEGKHNIVLPREAKHST